MTNKYDDIIDLPHHRSSFFKPMPMENRAAQFSPFAALAGHNEALAEGARITESQKELSEEEIMEITNNLSEALRKNCPTRIKYFLPDSSKKGGSYVCFTGKLKKIDEFEKLVITEKGEKIALEYISDVMLISHF